jgi:hypothetical protein
MAQKRTSKSKLELSEKQENTVNTTKIKVQVKGKKNVKKELNPDIKKFGEKIKKRRIELGYKNSDFFAYDNSITRSQYSRYESGTDDLRLSSVLKLLRLMQIKPSEFFKDFD